jgi:hypothetical protein
MVMAVEKGRKGEREKGRKGEGENGRKLKYRVQE